MGLHGFTDFEVKRLPVVKGAKTGGPIEMPFGFRLGGLQGSMCYVCCQLAPSGDCH